MFLDLFPRPKPIMAMLHLNGDNRDDILARAIREADIYATGGVDAMIVEDYYGDSADVERVLAVLANLAAALNARQYGPYPLYTPALRAELLHRTDTEFNRLIKENSHVS